MRRGLVGNAWGATLLSGATLPPVDLRVRGVAYPGLDGTLVAAARWTRVRVRGWDPFSLLRRRRATDATVGSAAALLLVLLTWLLCSSWACRLRRRVGLGSGLSCPVNDSLPGQACAVTGGRVFLPAAAVARCWYNNNSLFNRPCRGEGRGGRPAATLPSAWEA